MMMRYVYLIVVSTVLLASCSKHVGQMESRALADDHAMFVVVPVGSGEVTLSEGSLSLALSATTVLDTLHFESNSFILNGLSLSKLKRAVRILKKHDNFTVLIKGHADELGTDSYNLRLSRLRAEEVRNYLIGHGVKAFRINLSAYGEQQPSSDNDSEKGRADNRRVELVVR